MDPDKKTLSGNSFSVGAIDAEGISGAGKKSHDPGMGLRHVLDQSVSVVNKIVRGIVDPSPLEIDPVSFREGNDMGKGRRIKARAKRRIL
jgi:hypothetical protein